MNKLNHTFCPICKGTNIQPVMKCKDYYATKEIFELYHCNDCNFTFTQGVPVENEMGKYYESPEYISHSDTRKGAMNLIYHWVRHFMLQKKAELIQKETGLKSGNLLDIGTGTGYFLHTMQQKGWEVTGTEKNEQARHFAKQHFKLDIKDEKSLKILPSESFHVITLWHVMEHLEHLDDTWKQLSRLLKSGGIVIVAVPNCASYDAKLYKDKWAAYDVPRHLWHFIPQTMLKIGEQYEFQLRHFYPMPFDAYYVSMLSEKNINKSHSFLRGLWKGFQAQLRSRKNKELSSSITYIFRKQ